MIEALGRVVLADDMPFTRRLWRDVLERSGRYAVVGEAGDGCEALRLCLQEHPDVLVTDYQMPGLDGLALIRRLRDTSEHLVIVLSTGEVNPDLADNATALGAAVLEKSRAAELPRLLDDRLGRQTP